MKRYLLAERILHCKLPYGGKNDIHEGYVVFDTTTGDTASELIKNKNEAQKRAYEMNYVEVDDDEEMQQ